MLENQKINKPFTICALLATFYCAYIALKPEVEEVCATAGCRMFQDFSYNGISLWWVGTAFFLFLVFLSVFRKWKFLFFSVSVALAVDAILLLIMLSLAPCVPCLGAGLVIAITDWLALKKREGQQAKRIWPYILLALWFGLFLAASLLAGLERYSAWSIAGDIKAERRIYFSPSCPACMDAVVFFEGRAAFVPIAEREGDSARIYEVWEAVREGRGLKEALFFVLQKERSDLKAPGVFEGAMLQARLLRNKVEVLRLGFNQLPLVMVNGFPKELRAADAPNVEMEGNNVVDPFIFSPSGDDDLNSCGGAGSSAGCY